MQHAKNESRKIAKSEEFFNTLLELNDEIADLDSMIEAMVTDFAPELLAQTAIGLNSAAQLLLTAGDNSDRLKSELEVIRCLKRYIAREIFAIITRRHKEINQSQIAA